MKDNVFYKFSSRKNDYSRKVNDTRRFLLDDKGETLFSFDTAFEYSEKFKCSKNSFSLFQQKCDDLFLSRIKENAKELFSKHFSKSFILPNGGFIIEWEKHSKRLYIIADEYDDGIPVLNAIYKIDKVDFNSIHTEIEFDFEDDFKDSWNWHMSLAAGHIARFLCFVEFYRSNDIIKDEVSNKSQSSIKNDTQESEWKTINMDYFRKTILDCPFGVKGHWRNQRYGKDRSLTKKIFIKDFVKQGYNLS